MLIPALANEIVWDTRGKIQQTSQSKDSVSFAFRNGSILQNIAMTENSRGMRFQCVLVEECAKVDQDKLLEIVMPMMVISRKVNGEIDPNEMLNQSAVFVTSAGWKDSFAYQKLIQTLCEMVAKPAEAFIIGGDWKVPVIEGLQPANFIQSQEMDSSMEEGGFDREYGSIWAGNVQGAFFDSAKFDKYRQLNLPEHQYNNRVSAKTYYVMGVDIGRFDDCTEVVVIKVTPTNNNTWVKQVVNIITLEPENAQIQCVKMKRIFQKYKCDCAVVDGNGVKKLAPDNSNIIENNTFNCGKAA